MRWLNVAIPTRKVSASADDPEAFSPCSGSNAEGVFVQSAGRLTAPPRSLAFNYIYSKSSANAEDEVCEVCVRNCKRDGRGRFRSGCSDGGGVIVQQWSVNYRENPKLILS